MLLLFFPLKVPLLLFSCKGLGLPRKTTTDVLGCMSGTTPAVPTCDFGLFFKISMVVH